MVFGDISRNAAMPQTEFFEAILNDHNLLQINTYNELVLIFMLLIVCTETIKNSEHHLIKINGLHYITILSKS